MLSQRAHEPARSPELFVALKAALSSGAATLADGLVYQLLLFAVPTHYGVVAAAGAVAGAVVNFLINRRYTFLSVSERVLPQAIRYALVLAGTVEGLGWSPRIAWLPAKLAAFAGVSYPAQRLWVFSKRVTT